MQSLIEAMLKKPGLLSAVLSYRKARPLADPNLNHAGASVRMPFANTAQLDICQVFRNIGETLVSYSGGRTLLTPWMTAAPALSAAAT